MSEEGERLSHLFPSCPCLLMIYFSMVCKKNQYAGRVGQWNGVLSQLAQDYYNRLFPTLISDWSLCDACWSLRRVQGKQGPIRDGCEPLDAPKTFWLGKTKQTLDLLSSNKEILAPGEVKANSKLFPIPHQDLSVFWSATLLLKSIPFQTFAFELLPLTINFLQYHWFQLTRKSAFKVKSTMHFECRNGLVLTGFFF